MGACRDHPFVRFLPSPAPSTTRTVLKHRQTPKPRGLVQCGLLRLDDYRDDHRAPAMGSADPLAHPPPDQLLQLVGVGGAVA